MRPCSPLSAIEFVKSRRYGLLAGLLVALLVLTGCSSIAVKADFDEEANFNNYVTFNIIRPQAAPPGKLGTNPVAMRRIERAIESELVIRGFRGDSRQRADLLIAYHAGVRDKIDVTPWGYRYGRQWQHAEAQKYREGTLVIDLIDRERMEVVWRGWATGVLGSDDRPQEAINGVVADILKRYPPK